MNTDTHATPASATSAVAAATSPAGSANSRVLMGVLVVLLLLALGWWFLIRPGSLGPAAGVAASAPAPGEPARAGLALTDAQLERMVAQATEQAKLNPQDKAAWAMLAHSNEMLGKFAEAKKAYAKLAALAPDDAQVLADYADAMGVANGRSLLGEPEALIQRALALDAKNIKALMLASTVAMEKDETANATQWLERARAASTDAALNRQIDQTLAQIKAPPAPSASGAVAAAASAPATAASKVRLAAGPARISGRIWLAQDLAATAPPDATVFIMAHPAQGSRMPVALLRKKVKDLPLEFTLDESMGMVKDTNLAYVSAVVVVARVSLRGDVSPKAGDMQGVSAPVPVGTSGLKLEISEVLK